MKEDFGVRAPFFEIGPKLYMWGDRIARLADRADEAAGKYGVDVLMTVQYTDVPRLSGKGSHLRILAQHMDPDRPGRGMGKVLPEALAEAGADGVMLNHAERPLPMDVLEETIRRADEVGLGTVVCAGSVEEAKRIAAMAPNVIIVEDPRLIGTGVRSEQDQKEAEQAYQAIKDIDGRILVLLGAGISDEKDVYRVMDRGSDGTGSTSGIMKAADPEEMAEKMIRETRRGYDAARKRKENP